ncbi:hypothetical protein LMG3410_01524 [Achromobacter aegrifaciens]|uniref:Uncharacterized protein n=2 Tax=Alcaligenaceae TaxID=506 RepID=A0ABM8LL37_9BURK|nr:hypothetical protein LMG3410_01524 [Achromobacter aegrifaciens]CAB3913936.1 hypothetical protein LMG3415_05125 [Achromobacter mucicolens]
MTAPLPLSPLTRKAVFLAALAAGRTVPEDETHVIFANCVVEQIYKLGYRLSATDDFEQPEGISSELAAPQACLTRRPLPGLPPIHMRSQHLPAVVSLDVDSLGEVWRACLEAVAQRVAGMDLAGFTPTSCASALLALVRTSHLACIPCGDQIEVAQ